MMFITFTKREINRRDPNMVSINSACREHVGPSGGKKTGAVVAKIDTGESSVSRAIPI